MDSLKRNMPVIHPGQFLKEELIVANNLTITEVAGMLKVSRQALSNIINMKADVSPEMALRISARYCRSAGNRIPSAWLTAAE